MKFNVTIPNDLEISDELQKQIYIKSKEQIKMLDDFCMVHIRVRPKWMPKFIYKFFISKIFVLDRFIR